MSEREDLPFISMPDEDTKARYKQAPAKPAAPPPARPAPEPVDMVARPTGKSPDRRPPLSNPAPLTLPSAATMGSPSAGFDKIQLIEESNDVVVEKIAEPKPAAAPAPAAKAPPPPPTPAPSGDDADALLERLNQQHSQIQDALRGSTVVRRERDEARARAAALEHEAAQLRQQVQELKPAADKSKALQRELDASLMSHSQLSTDNAKLKMRANELEERAQEAEARAAQSEEQLKDAKAGRDDAEKRIVAAVAALQRK